MLPFSQKFFLLHYSCNSLGDTVFVYSPLPVVKFHEDIF